MENSKQTKKAKALKKKFKVLKIYQEKNGKRRRKFSRKKRGEKAEK